MVKIIFESHGTTFDNEKGISTGQADSKLSPLGIKQSKELGERYKDNLPDIVFCSDLSRSVGTGKIAFGNTGVPILTDPRLRECDYGDYTQHPSEEVSSLKDSCIDIPFPNGESYKQIAERMKDFLKDLLQNYNGKTVMMIGHRATQYGLEHLINKISLEQVINAPWKWQPGRTYQLEEI